MSENFSGRESLKLINEMMLKAKKSYVSKGTASIVWGILIIVCSLFTWAKIQFNLNIGFDIWWLLFLAIIPQIFFSIKEGKNKNFIAHDEITIGYVWAAFGICISILTLYSSKFGNESSTSLFMMLYGIPTFLTGGICKFRPMIVGGVICWVLSIVSLFTNRPTDMLLIGACGLFAWLIPGIILWNKHSKK